MKRGLLTFILFFSFVVLGAQVSKTLNDGKIGLSFSTFGDIQYVNFKEACGMGSYNGLNFYSLGVNFVKPLNSWLDLETGLEFSRHTFKYTPMFTGIGVVILPRNVSASMLDIPVTLRVNFLKYFFINGGITLDFDTDINSNLNSQTGIGVVLGAAIKYDFKSGVSFFVNPYSKIRSVVPFASNHFRESIVESGIRFGVLINISTLVR